MKIFCICSDCVSSHKIAPPAITLSPCYHQRKWGWGLGGRRGEKKKRCCQSGEFVLLKVPGQIVCRVYLARRNMRTVSLTIVRTLLCNSHTRRRFIRFLQMFKGQLIIRLAWAWSHQGKENTKYGYAFWILKRLCVWQILRASLNSTDRQQGHMFWERAMHSV